MPLDPRGHIILDSIKTWPASIHAVLASEEARLRLHTEEERRLDDLARSDVLLRIHRPANPHKDVWDQTAEKVRQLVSSYPVVGFHCSRLTPEEIADVRSNGLRPLSRALTCERIDRLVRQNLVSPAVAAPLKRPDHSRGAKLARREGLISFFHCLSTLRRDAGGLYRLLRYWGGEAVYGHHEERSPETVDALSRIGAPCIVVATLQPSDVGIFGSFEERLIGVWLDRRRPDAHSHHCDTQVENRSLPVLEVIEYADSRFEELTGCSNWHYRIESG